MQLDMRKDREKLYKRKDILGTNRELGIQLAKYKELAETSWQANQRLSAIEFKGFLFTLLMILVGLVAFTFTEKFIIFPAAIGGAVGYSWLCRRRPKMAANQASKKMEEACDDVLFAYIRRYNSGNHHVFLSFLADAKETFDIYLLDERPLTAPTIPTGMALEWQYLLEQEGQSYQIAWRGDDEVANYIVLPVDPFTGEIRDNNIQPLLFTA